MFLILDNSPHGSCIKNSRSIHWESNIFLIDESNFPEFNGQGAEEISWCSTGVNEQTYRPIVILDN